MALALYAMFERPHWLCSYGRWPLRRGSVTFAMSATFPPFEFKPVGFDIDLMKKMALTVTVSPGVWGCGS